MTASPLPVVKTVRDARQIIFGWREKGETVTLVPTMGALHKGHMALVNQAKSISKRTIASIFVNPTQFGPKEDLSRYPRQLEADIAMLTNAGCDLLFAPDVAEMYPEGFNTSIDPGPLATILEGKFRPGHFAGVATVVMKLMLQMMPDAGLFGEKDYQQLMVLRHVAKDLDLPLHIIGVPIVRDEDGLALSSRNVYLSSDERQRALALPRTLQKTRAAIQGGQDIEAALKAGCDDLAKAGFVVDYLELADATTLQPLRKTGTPGRLLAAARMGTTRLIDNISV